mgnify:FL=1
MKKNHSFTAPLCAIVVLVAACAMSGSPFSHNQEQFLNKCRAVSMKNRRKDCGNVAEQLRQFIQAKSEMNKF